MYMHTPRRQHDRPLQSNIHLFVRSEVLDIRIQKVVFSYGIHGMLYLTAVVCLVARSTDSKDPIEVTGRKCSKHGQFWPSSFKDLGPFWHICPPPPQSPFFWSITYITGIWLLTVPPNIVDSGSSKSKVAVRENANVTLRCQADGFPTPNITWKREDGRVITLDRQNQGKTWIGSRSFRFKSTE